jgi:hypothetical protein
MNREEAMAVLKEIVKICQKVGVTYISLKSAKESESYELHIEDHFDEKDCEILQNILQKHNLSMRKNDGRVIIYTS